MSEYTTNTLPSRELLEPGDRYHSNISGFDYVWSGAQWLIAPEEKKPVADTKYDPFGELATPYIPAVVEQLRLTLKSKNEDYAPTTEFSNFEQAAALVGVSPRLAIMLQIGIKYSRLTSLIESDAEANFEGIRDTLMDLAGYSMIAVAHMDKLSDDDSL